MRILHVIESFAAGGIETTFLNVLRHLRAEDGTVEHHVLAFAGGPLEEGYREAAHAVTIGCEPDVLSRLAAAPYDVAHVLFERCAVRLAPEFFARSTTPVVYAKGYDLGGMYRLNEGFDWQADESLLASCDAATFTTASLAAGYDLPPGRTTVLGKAADVARFQSIPDPDASTPMRIVCVANLHPRKRLADLVRAFVQVRRHVPRAELRLVGGDSTGEGPRLMAFARHLGVEDGVTLAGLLRDVAPEIAAARVVALPSSCEGVPTALLEGMAAGRPVVATSVGHVASIVEDGVEGFLIPLGHITTLAERLTRLLEDPALAFRMGRAARARAARHDVRVIAKHWLQALRAAA
jgi:glycosyltransferase involved in cell wall biosynthesis